MSSGRGSPVVVLGVGNVIMSDEGVGVRCVQRLEEETELPKSVRLIDGGTSTHELLEDLEHAGTLVIVDAVESGAPAGTLVRLEGDEVPSAFSNAMSPHQHGINDLLATLRLLDRAPERVVLVGVQPAKIELGLELSPTVAEKLPELCARVRDEVAVGLAAAERMRGRCGRS